MDNIITYEYKDYPATPETNTDLNSPNKDIIFDIYAGDGFLHPCNADVYIKYKLVEKNGTEYNDGAEVRVVHDFFPNMCSQILVDICDTTIDKLSWYY